MSIKTMQRDFSQELHTEREDEHDDAEFVEVDPTKRYGRYGVVLGEGAYKTVYKAFDTTDGIEVAWNQVKVQDAIKNCKDLERLHSEVKLLKSLKHKNIIKFYDSWVDCKTKNVNFITEIFFSGNLRQYRRKHKNVDMKAVKSWARQILRGLLYLHSHDPPIIHRDIKCDNIFINGNNGDVKIGDLGLAVVLQQTCAAHSVIGTPEFMAPELYEEDYTELVDVYSFGMCLLELVTLEYPYSECHNAAQIFKKVTSGKKPIALDKVKDPEFRRFVDQCLADASRRLPARELLKDPFLQTSEIIEPIISLHPYHSQAGRNGTKGLATISEAPAKILNDQVEAPSHSRDSSNLDQASPSLVRGFEKTDVKNYARFEDTYLCNLTETPSKNIQELISRNSKGDSVIKLIIRLKDKDGHSQAITFSFNIEADSALAVASEMVVELGLFDEDVVAIAEQIDSELLTLVPNWKPGAAFDESIDEEKSSDQLVNDVGNLKLVALVPNWKQVVGFDQLLDVRDCMSPRADRQGQTLSSKRPTLDLLSSPIHLPTTTSFDSTLSFDSPTYQGQEHHPSDSCHSEKCSSFSGDTFEVKHIGDIKDLISEIVPSNAVNPSNLEEVKSMPCGQSGPVFTASITEAVITLKLASEDASKNKIMVPSFSAQKNLSQNDPKYSSSEDL